MISRRSDEQQYCGTEFAPLFTFLLGGWCGPVSPFDSLLEFLLNLTPTFTVHRIEEELFVGADADTIDQTFGEDGPRIFY